MKVVCNSSPLVNLARIGRLHLLEKLYTEITIPQAVYQEVVINGQGFPGADEISKANWISVEKIIDQRHVQILSYNLDLGESEAIVLALQGSADLLLMDERIGRDMARHLGLIFTGTIGALMDAKDKGIIEHILPVVVELRTKAGFRISEVLFKHIEEVSGKYWNA